MTKHSSGWHVPAAFTAPVPKVRPDLPNPMGVRSVAIIVTYEDDRLDYSMTFTPEEILADPGVVVDVKPFPTGRKKVHFELDAIPNRPGPWH